MEIGNIPILIAGLLWGIELVPQVLKTLKTQNVEGVSLLFFSTCLLAYFLYMVGNALVQNWIVVLSHIPSLILNIVMLSLILKYKKEK